LFCSRRLAGATRLAYLLLVWVGSTESCVNTDMDLCKYCRRLQIVHVSTSMKNHQLWNEFCKRCRTTAQ